MVHNIINIFKTATSFLQTGIAPPNTPDGQKEELEKINHFSSKKFFVIFSSASMLAFMYFSSVAILFFIPKTPEIINGYVTVFSKTIEIFSYIIISYLGTQLAMDLKYGKNSNDSSQQSYEKLTQNIKEKDYEIPVS